MFRYNLGYPTQVVPMMTAIGLSWHVVCLFYFIFYFYRNHSHHLRFIRLLSTCPFDIINPLLKIVSFSLSFSHFFYLSISINLSLTHTNDYHPFNCLDVRRLGEEGMAIGGTVHHIWIVSDRRSCFLLVFNFFFSRNVNSCVLYAHHFLKCI